MSHAGREVARTGSSATFAGRYATGAAHTNAATKVPDCVGAQSTCIGRRNHEITCDLERTLRRMKKVVFTMLQLAVTAAVLYYVFHDPKKLHQMWQALEQADYRWVFAAVGAYIIVEIAAALRWQILLRVQGIYLNWPRLFGLFL